MRESEIKFKIKLDEGNLPEEIKWQATDSEQTQPTDAKAIMLSIWDPNDKATLRIDLWTKDMLVDDMKLFFHQTLVSMINTYERSTNDQKNIKQMREFASYMAEEMNLIKK